MRRFWTAPVFCLISVITLFITAKDASAQPAQLTSRLPRDANAAMLIDVNKLLQSPLGKQEQLQSKLISGYADRPLAVPGTARRVAIAALVDPTGLESIWQVALIDLPSAPRVEPMVRAQGGYLDKVDGRNVAWSRREIMYVELDDHTLGVVRPGSRQFVARWFGAKGEAGLSPRLGAALAAAKDADAVLAVDLDGAVGPAAVNYALMMGQLPSLEKVAPAQPALVNALASVTDMRVALRFTDKIEGEWVINFGQSVAALGADAKPFILDVLRAGALYAPAVEQNWVFKTEQNKITGTGTMDMAGFTRLVALLAPGDIGQQAPAGSNGEPAPAAAVPAAAAAPPAAAPASNPPANPVAAAENAIVVASQKYFRAISKSLDSISVKASPTEGASWLLAQARQMDQLPVLNVDPDLLAWGQSVSQGYTRAGQEMATGQQRAKVAAEQVATPTAYATWTPVGGTSSTDTPETMAAYKNAQQQRRAAAQTERSAAAQRALDIFNQLVASRGKIRVDMTQKYGVEF